MLLSKKKIDAKTRILKKKRRKIQKKKTELNQGPPEELCLNLTKNQ